MPLSQCRCVAQLVRALPLHGRGCWFESSRAYQITGLFDLFIELGIAYIDILAGIDFILWRSWSSCAITWENSSHWSAFIQFEGRM